MPQADLFTHPDKSAVRKQYTEAKKIMKGYADKWQHTKANSININPRSGKLGAINEDDDDYDDDEHCILVRQHKQNKLMTPYDPTPLVVKERKRSISDHHH